MLRDKLHVVGLSCRLGVADVFSVVHIGFCDEVGCCHEEELVVAPGDEVGCVVVMACQSPQGAFCGRARAESAKTEAIVKIKESRMMRGRMKNERGNEWRMLVVQKKVRIVDGTKDQDIFCIFSYITADVLDLVPIVSVVGPKVTLRPESHCSRNGSTPS